MSESENESAFSLIPSPSRELATLQTAQTRILGEMVSKSLALASVAITPAVDLDALVREGKRLQRKRGMTAEDVRAFQLFRQAAVAEHPEAQYLVSECYREGHGISQSISLRIEWLHKAAEQGFATAQCNLGFCYDHGQGVPQDYVEAVKWYRKAAEQGSASGQHDLGFCYTNGQGVPQDYVEAVKWYRKAAEQGERAAQHNLGRCYANGNGVDIDLPQAFGWFQLAADQGSQNAEMEATALAALMSPSELAMAHRHYEISKALFFGKQSDHARH